MDSGFLNVFCDDSYITYDNDIEYWSNTNVDTLGMELWTETLDGILPIPPTENFHMDNNSNFSINSFTYDERVNEEHFTVDAEIVGDDTVELSLDTHADDYDTDNEDNIIYCHDYDDGDLEDDDQYSQYSNDMYKMRSVSSSIGDYESHSSDYDNFNEVFVKTECRNDIMDSIENEKYSEFTPVEQTTPIKLSKINVDTNASAHHKLGSLDQLVATADINDNGLGLNIDANNFDLAEFITQDDIMVNSSASTALTELVQMELEMKMSVNDKSPILLSKQNDKIEKSSSLSMLSNISMDSGNILVMSTENCHSDADSDIIVDVETVEANEDDSILFANRISVEDIIVGTDDEDDTENITEGFIDNIKEDPSWTPSKLCNKKFDTKEPITNELSQKCLKNTKDIGKKKSRRRQLKNPTSNVKKQEDNGHKKCVEKDENNTLQESNMKTSENSSINQTEIKSDNKSQSSGSNCSTVQPAVKRKLNLEEYKKRRCDVYFTMNDNKTSIKQSGVTKTIKVEECINSMQKSKVSHNTHSAEVTSIVKSLKEEQQQKQQQQQQQKSNKTKPIDPITIAKEKVLRMQQLKKAQQMRIIDSTISAKVPKVTKLPPLKEIVKNTEYDLNEKEIKTETEVEQQQKKVRSRDRVISANDAYDEIITISIRCNTDISIPPLSSCNADITLNKATQSLLKSTALLSTVSKTTDNVVLTKNSLIASIQDVMVKKVVHENQTKCSGIKDDNEKYHDAEHNGEDKIIMYLRKDRIRPTTCTIGMQTDFQAQFPTLSILTSSKPLKHKARKSRHKKALCKINGTSRYDSSDQLADSAEESDISQLRQYQSREGSCSSSVERARVYDSAIGTGYSSRGSCKNRSSISSSYSETHRSRRRQRRTSYKQRQRINSRTRSSSSCSSSSSSYSDITTTDSSDYERSHSSRHARRHRRSLLPSCTRSRSRSWSPSSSRSKSISQNSYPKYNQHKGDNTNTSSNNASTYQPAVEERRIVYVGHIEQKTTKDMLRKKFLSYGNIKHISTHYKENGMKYGFVTYERAQDAFAVIDNSTKDPKINMYDISFGGRRAFCRSTYADLDNAGINTYHSYVFPTNSMKRPDEQQEESFETLLMKMKEKLNAHKQASNSKTANEI